MRCGTCLDGYDEEFTESVCLGCGRKSLPVYLDKTFDGSLYVDKKSLEMLREEVHA